MVFLDKRKVLVVDDSVVYRKIISAAVEGTGLAVVENTASNGLLAIERLQCGKYDIVLLDVNMPEMDGIEALKIIKRQWPRISVIMISGTGGKSAVTTLQALENGAMDFIVKPLEEDYEKNMEIVRNHLKLLFVQIQAKEAASRVSALSVQPPRTIAEVKKETKVRLTGVDLVLIASSTGGPVALEKIFENFGRNFLKPLLIVQHMPPDFTKVLSDSLDKISSIKFIEGHEGDFIRSGQGIVAPGGYHMLVSKDGVNKKITLSKSDYVNGVRPAADVLFKSVAEEYASSRILAVILTGMGSDGLAGVRELKKKCSCYCITQSEASCVVYGMPRSVAEEGLSDEVLDIGDIAHRIQQIVEHGS